MSKFKALKGSVIDEKREKLKPKISIIVPVYNTEKFLQDCIDSLINQTMEDIEIIFINDASPDNCLNILNRNQKLHADKIKIIDLKENLRQGGARNLGIHEARADYIAFVDSDDFVAPTMFEEMYNRILERQADACLINYVMVEEDALYAKVIKADIEQTYQKAMTYTNIEKWDSVTLTESQIEEVLVSNFVGVWTALWRKQVILDNAIYFPEHLRFEDNFWTSLIACYTRRYTFIDKIYYFYRHVSQSTVHSKNQLYFWERVIIMNLLLDEVKRRDLFKKYYAAWEYETIMKCFSSYFIFMHAFDKPPVELVKKIPQEHLKHFPRWKNNVYYKAAVRKPRRIKYMIISKMPITMLYIHPVMEKVTKLFKKMEIRRWWKF